MAESRRKGYTPALDDEKTAKHERSFVIAFGVGMLALISGMIFIADGLSTDFHLDSLTFIVFAVLGGLTGVATLYHWLLSKKVA